MVLLTFRLALTSAWDYSERCLLLLARLIAALCPGTQDATSGDLRSPVLRYHAKLRVRYKTRRGTATYSVLPYTKHRESPGGCL